MRRDDELLGLPHSPGGHRKNQRPSDAARWLNQGTMVNTLEASGVQLVQRLQPGLREKLAARVSGATSARKKVAVVIGPQLRFRRSEDSANPLLSGQANSSAGRINIAV